jgi:hypothetical protein
MKQRRYFKHAASLCLCIALAIGLQGQSKKQDSIRTIIVFFDGLRPDYITAAGMPNLYAFSKRSSYGKAHHSVFPTVTRVNATSYATGSYPGTHGLMGNSIYFPQVHKTKSLNTGNASELNAISKALDGHLLTAVSLGEVLKQQNKEMMVFSSGTTGQALMQNHTVSGAVINPAMILPESFKQNVINDIGPIPPAAKPNTPRHKWITDALIHYSLRMDGPLVSAIWFSDPDGTAHSDGIGSPTAVASIKSVDEQFGRILAAIEEKGYSDYFNIVISTDHGFVTHVGKENLSDFLISKGLKKDANSDDVVLAGGAIYVKDHDTTLIQQIVTALQSQEWAGAIFTKGSKKGDVQGQIAGTLSFESIHWNHADRSADILVDVNWNDNKNEAGYAGTSFSRGVAGHGSLSPYEVHIALLAAGPGFKKSYQSGLPTSNVDLVPTILHLHQLPIPATVTGRVIHELLVERNKAAMPVAKQEVIETSATYAGGKYKLILDRTILGNYQYINFAKVIREKGSASGQ